MTITFCFDPDDIYLATFEGVKKAKAHYGFFLSLWPDAILKDSEISVNVCPDGLLEFLRDHKGEILTRLGPDTDDDESI